MNGLKYWGSDWFNLSAAVVRNCKKTGKSCVLIDRPPGRSDIRTISHYYRIDSVHSFSFRLLKSVLGMVQPIFTYCRKKYMQKTETEKRNAYTMRKNLPKTLDQLNIHQYLVNVLKVTKYLVNVPKFAKYLVNSYHQKGVKHYVLTN